MPIIPIDFSQIPDDTIEPGEYDAVLDHVQVKQKADGSGQYLNWRFTFADGEQQGRKVWGITSLSPAGLWKTKEEFSALGLDPSSLRQLEIDDLDLIINPPLMNIPVRISVFNETYNGQERAKVDKIVEVHQPLQDVQAEGDDEKVSLL